MIFKADMKVRFSGPDREEQALDFINEAPPGSTQYLGEDPHYKNTATVKMLRSIEVRVVGLAEPGARKRRGALRAPAFIFDMPGGNCGAALLPLLLFIMFGCLVAGGLPGVVVGLGKMAPATNWSAWPALLANLPDPKDFGTIGWFVVILFTLIGFAGMIPAAINGWRSLFRGEKRPEPTALEQPIVTRREERMARWDELQSLRTEFEKFRSEIRDDFAELKKGGEERAEKLTAEIHNSATELMKASNSSASKAHVRIDAVAEKQGQLIGKVDQMNENLRLLLAQLGGKKS